MTAVAAVMKRLSRLLEGKIYVVLLLLSKQTFLRSPSFHRRMEPGFTPDQLNPRDSHRSLPPWFSSPGPCCHADTDGCLVIKLLVLTDLYEGLHTRCVPSPSNKQSPNRKRGKSDPASDLLSWLMFIYVKSLRGLALPNAKMRDLYAKSVSGLTKLERKKRSDARLNNFI